MEHGPNGRHSHTIDAPAERSITVARGRKEGGRRSETISPMWGPASAGPCCVRAIAPAGTAITDAAASITGMPVFGARDVAATLDWYAALGFTEVVRYPAEGPMTFYGLVTLGAAELAIDIRVPAPLGGATLLLVTNRIRDLDDHLRSRPVEVVFLVRSG